MKRHAHYLKPVAGGALPTSILSVAVAGTIGKGGYWACRSWWKDAKEFGDGSQAFGNDAASLWHLVRWHSGCHPGTWVMMNNACQQLTELGFWDLLEDGKWEVYHETEKGNCSGVDGTSSGFCGVAIIADPPTIIIARPYGLRAAVKILDIRNYGVGGIAEIYFGPKPQGDCQTEAKVAAASIDAFARELVAAAVKYRLGSLKMTAASQAMHTYRHRFLKSMVLCHDDQACLGHERNAMYAGRCEAWRLGVMPKGVYHLDFNAFYPSVVLGQGIPVRKAGFVLGCNPEPRELMRQGYLVISEVQVETSKRIVPCRFSRSRHARASVSSDGSTHSMLCRDRDLLYPIGKFSTTLCGPELLLAYTLGTVRRVFATSWYEPSELFTQWACELAIMEEEARDGHSLGYRRFVKRLRNSLFGKFGQWAWQWQNACDEPHDKPYEMWYGDNPDGGPAIRYRSIANLVQRETKLGESLESCPAIAAWVYSLARAKLWEAIEVAGEDNVYYMDSDSLWCNHDGFTRLKQGGWLHHDLPGKLKLVGMHEQLTIHGLKHYTKDGVNVAAGVPLDSAGSHGTGWTFSRQETMAQAILLGRSPDNRTVRTNTRPSGVYRHGVATTGGVVLPYTFNED